MRPEAEAVPTGGPEVPDVSVIIPAYNAMPYLIPCLDSIVTQTLGADRMEVIVIDDGSSDGTSEELDTWAAEYPNLFRVLHEPGSGGPAAPRNTGLDLARGRFVHFVDADDYLGQEALERLLNAADSHGSDVVLGRMKGVGGRGVPQSMFKENQPDADLFESRVFWTLAPLKLFRREMLEEHGLRFPTHFPNCSDQPFTAEAYFRARRITVLADYDYYFAVQRDDGKHVTSTGTVSNRLDVVEWMCELVSQEVPDRARRAPLLLRQFQIDLRRVMRGLAGGPQEREVRLVRSPQEQKALLARVAVLIRTHLSPEIVRALTPGIRVAYDLTRRELFEEAMAVVELEAAETPYEITVEADRVFARLPYFRDPAVPVPDELYDVTDRVKGHHMLTSFECSHGSLRVAGTAGFRNVASVPDVEVVLRSHPDPTQAYAVAASRTEDHGFEASVDLLTVADGRRLPDGHWNVHLRISQQGISRMPRLHDHGSDDLVRDPCLTFAAVDSGTKWTARAFLTPTGSLRLDVGGTRSKLGHAFRGWSASWVGTDLLVSGTAALRFEAPLALTVANGAGDVRSYRVEADGERLLAQIPVTELPEGTWGVRLRFGDADANWAVDIPAQPRLAEGRWRRSLRWMSAASVVPAPTLTLQVWSRGFAREAMRRLVRGRVGARLSRT